MIVILGGDFNLGILKDTRNTRHRESLLAPYGFSVAEKRDTWAPAKFIDYLILTNYFCRVNVYDTAITDDSQLNSELKIYSK